ncbi:MAG: Mth938-like domain-containing protein [Planctomycetota bacterium]|jgi:hypothetical protein
MQIDSYQFGNIVISGTTYSSDCLIIGDAVHDNWWRKRGHLLAAEDLQSVIAARPSVLVVGCGAFGMMKVPEETRQVLQTQNIILIAVDTHKAVEKFNELAKKSQSVAAALHLTC